MNVPLRQDTLVDHVAQALRQMILSGEFGPGAFLPSRKELAARFGVGVSTVHEAMQALSALGLVESRPGKGTWVQKDALNSLLHPTALEGSLRGLRAHQVYEARCAVEVSLTELAAQRATPEDLARIWEALDRMEAALHDDRAFVEADMAFHVAVARAGHNDLLEQFYHVSRRLLAEHIAGLVKLPRVKENGLRIQRTIAEAIKRHDPILARRATLDHMLVIQQLLHQIDPTEQEVASSDSQDTGLEGVNDRMK